MTIRSMYLSHFLLIHLFMNYFIRRRWQWLNTTNLFPCDARSCWTQEIERMNWIDHWHEKCEIFFFHNQLVYLFSPRWCIFRFIETELSIYKYLFHEIKFSIKLMWSIYRRTRDKRKSNFICKYVPYDAGQNRKYFYYFDYLSGCQYNRCQK